MGDSELYDWYADHEFDAIHDEWEDWAGYGRCTWCNNDVHKAIFFHETTAQEREEAVSRVLVLLRNLHKPDLKPMPDINLDFDRLREKAHQMYQAQEKEEKLAGDEAHSQKRRLTHAEIYEELVFLEDMKAREAQGEDNSDEGLLFLAKK